MADDLKKHLKQTGKQDNTGVKLQPRLNKLEEFRNRQSIKNADLTMAKKGQSHLSNMFNDMGTTMIKNVTQFSAPTKEDIDKGRSGWSGRGELIRDGITHGLANELTGGLMGAISSGAVKTGAKQLISKGTNAIQNTHKLNPFAFKPDPNAFYRTIGKQGHKDALESGMVRANPNGAGIAGDRMSRPSDVSYFAKGEIGNYPGKDVVAEVKKPLYMRGETNPVTQNPIRGRHWGYRNIDETGASANVPNTDVKFLKKDWLQGYKEIKAPVTNAMKNPIQYQGPNNSFVMGKPDVTNTEALATGNNWTKDWVNSSEIQQRIDLNNFQILRRGNGQAPINKSMDLRTKFPNQFEDKVAQTHSSEPLVHNGQPGVFFDDVIQNHPTLRGKSFVDPNASIADIPSIAVHESSHKLTNGGRSHSFETDELLTDMLGGVNGVMYKKSRNPHLTTEINYFSKPTEIHARMNQMRQHYKLKPSDKVSPEQAAKMMTEVSQNKVPLVSTLFGNLMDNPHKVAQAFNNVFTPAAIAGTAALQLNKKK